MGLAQPLPQPRRSGAWLAVTPSGLFSSTARSGLGGAPFAIKYCCSRRARSELRPPVAIWRRARDSLWNRQRGGVTAGAGGGGSGQQQQMVELLA